MLLRSFYGHIKFELFSFNLSYFNSTFLVGTFLFTRTKKTLTKIYKIYRFGV